MSVYFLRRGAPPVITPDVQVGTTWLFEYGQDGTFVVPVTGTYQIEIHGGGGGGFIVDNSYQFGCGGGGSGELYEIELTKDDEIPFVIGAGGSVGQQGGSSSFGSITLAGGGPAGAQNVDAGSASGSIATAGGNGQMSNGAGGYGNKNNTSQTYGNGGSGANNSQTATAANMGKNGAVIVTLISTESSGGSSANPISFTLSGTSYQAEEGMTWEQFVNSQYNSTLGLAITNGYVTGMAGSISITYGGSKVKSTDVIVDGRTYSLSN